MELVQSTYSVIYVDLENTAKKDQLLVLKSTALKDISVQQEHQMNYSQHVEQDFMAQEQEENTLVILVQCVQQQNTVNNLLLQKQPVQMVTIDSNILMIRTNIQRCQVSISTLLLVL